MSLAAKALAAEIEARKSADAIIIAERPLVDGDDPAAAGAAGHHLLWKVIVWDKILAWGTTGPILGDVGVWAVAIVTTYVGGGSLEKIAKTIWGRR